MSTLFIAAKNGAEPEACVSLAKYIVDECKQLNLLGLMTIGSIEQSTTSNEDNRDFQVFLMDNSKTYVPLEF